MISAYCSPTTVTSGTNFSFEFHLQVAKDVIKEISSGTPRPEEIISATTNTGTQLAEQSEIDKGKKLTIETSIGDCRLWAEILRNLSKDLSRCSMVQIPDSLLSSIENDQSRSLEGSGDRKPDGIVAFSCGHAFSLAQFHSKVLLEFVDRVQDFPIPITLTLKHLQMQYKQSSFYTSACPYCVFQYLRKLQLQESPRVPIRPWNP